MKTQSQRQLRVSEKLRHALSEVLQRSNFGDPDLENANLMTVSEVRMSPDLKNATAYVSCLDDSKEAALIQGLNRIAPQIKGEIGRSAELRFTPRIRFVSDTSFDYARNIDALMHDEKFQRDVNAPDTDEDET
jgi:ribosome-binding factor A